MNKLKTCLYLDDQRTPSETIPGYYPWNVVRNYTAFTEWITKNGIPDFISFDHDLADEHITDYYSQVAQQGFQHPNYDSYEEMTGLNCADWLVSYAQENNIKIGRCAVHSHNPVGAANIQSLINGYKRHMGWEEDCYIGRVPFTVEK